MAYASTAMNASVGKEKKKANLQRVTLQQENTKQKPHMIQKGAYNTRSENLKQ